MPNTVVKLTNAESTWLEAAREDRKLLINMKAHLQRCAFLLLLKDICKDVLFALPSFGSGFKVHGSGLSWRLRRLFYWAMPESGILVMGYQS